MHLSFSLLNRNILWIYHDLCIHSVCDGQLASFQLLEAILNSAAVNILEHFFAEHVSAFLLRISKQKLHPTEEGKEDLIQGDCSRVETGMQSKLDSTETAVWWELLKAGVGRTGRLSLLTGHTQLLTFFLNRRSVCSLQRGTHWSEACVLQLRQQDTGAFVLVGYIISKGWFQGPQERQSWVVKLARGFEKKVYISKVQRKNLQ